MSTSLYYFGILFIILSSCSQNKSPNSKKVSSSSRDEVRNEAAFAAHRDVSISHLEVQNCEGEAEVTCPIEHGQGRMTRTCDNGAWTDAECRAINCVEGF